MSMNIPTVTQVSQAERLIALRACLLACEDISGLSPLAHHELTENVEKLIKGENIPDMTKAESYCLKILSTATQYYCEQA